MSESQSLSTLDPKVQPAAKVAVPSKTITISRVPGERWTFAFSDSVRIRDVNTLLLLMRREYLRMKRRNRIRARAGTRIAAVKPLKEATNAAG